MSKFGAVIVTHNSSAHVGKCIASLQDMGCVGIVAVDSGSMDDTVVRVRELDVQVIESSQNVGFAVGANMGASRVSTPYILFVNPDARVVSGDILEAVKYLDAHTNIALLGFRLEDDAGVPERYAYGDSTHLLSVLKKKAANYTAQGIRDVGWVSGGAMLVRRDSFYALRGFDKQFFLYWEDVDLCKRARGAGLRVVYYPLVTVQHVRGASFTDHGEKTRIYDQSADRYFRKHYATPIWLFQWILRRLYRLFSWQVR